MDLRQERWRQEDWQGGIFAGIFADKLKIQKSGSLIIACSVCVFPVSISLLAVSAGIINYIVITVYCFAVMAFSTIFTVQMMSFVQAGVPQHLMGKVIAVILLSVCARSP